MAEKGMVHLPLMGQHGGSRVPDSTGASGNRKPGDPRPGGGRAAPFTEKTRSSSGGPGHKRP
jgi:hypothetical protein